MKFCIKLQIFIIFIFICCFIKLIGYRSLIRINSTDNSQPRIFSYNHHSPLVLISGYPGSGMNLIRGLINQLSNAYCQKDSGTIHSMLTSYAILTDKQPLEMKRLLEAKITKSIIYDAYQSFILELFLQRNKFSEILCNTEYLYCSQMVFLKEMFPNLKLILMIRDGRALVYSHMRKNGFKNSKTSENVMPTMLYDKWANSTSELFDFCIGTGSQSCLLVYFENLILEPDKTMRKVSRFLGFKNKNIPNFSELIIKSKLSIQNNELPRFYLNSTQMLKLLKFGYEPSYSVYPVVNNKTYFSIF